MRRISLALSSLENQVFQHVPAGFVVIMGCMRYKLRFLWNATKGHRLAPWRSPYLLWRIETYTGVKMTQIGFLEFWEFVWRERHELLRFLKWTGDMERWVRPRPKNT
jgi:hypothetical protein